MKKLLIIDFFNLMHRAFHAYPHDFKTSKGIYTNAAFGFTNLLLTYLNKINPTHVVVAYEDDEEPTFRSTDYTNYKSNRTWAEDHPEEAELFYNQVPYALEVLQSLNIPYIKCNGYEADDVAGTLTKKAEKDTEVIILSNDQDLLQLVNSSNITVLRPARPPFVKEMIFNAKEVTKKFGFGPEKIPDYKGLRGDPSDNIPGVKGIGEKTATDLLKQFDSVEDIYKNIEKIDKKRTKTLLAENAENAVMSKKLAIIDTNCPIQYELKKYEVKDFDIKKAEKVFKKYEFTSLKKKLYSLFEKKENKSVSEGQCSLF
ncbi:hypothetical protein COV24_03320 [candidate division WWE3 bacterium CG10_big_fil_rev_8_21_14_0_10_32_10]|uniref:5'-3' exonuclease domain-containing protein n=1 Tax=candidate division WWE3 bacterium CG10_big_fil_rev_8_21_14_0_10_32_10 TaxID=1975090 RepID=A0A2H0R9Y9_UNCKA|nr:MAG: hypothetical protein COV24_03320 [candidate division WWE3 bacterium CG10_big_fil_rev_8_21_14_0_10_32_10]